MEGNGPISVFWAVVRKLLKNRISEKFSSRKAKFESRKPISGKFGYRIEILSTHNFFYQKFAVYVRKFPLSYPAYFF